MGTITEMRGNTAGAEYRAKALEFITKAQSEPNPAIRAEFRTLAAAYDRLAKHAEQFALNDIVYETPRRRTGNGSGDGASGAQA